MWGENILVCPVLEKGATQRKLYLPAGTWYNFFTDKKTEGYKWTTENVDLQNIPVFVKEGSFIPMFISDFTVHNTNDYTGKDLTVKYFPSSKQTNSIFYDDDGKTKNTLATGKFQVINFEGNQSGKKINIKIYETKTSGIPRKIKLLLPEDLKIQSVKINNRSFSIKDNLNLLYAGKPLSVNILLK